MPSAPSSTAGTPYTEDGPQNTRILSIDGDQRGVVVVPVARALLDRNDSVEIGKPANQRRRQIVHGVAGDIVEQDRHPRLADHVAIMREDLVVGKLDEIGRQDQDAINTGLVGHVGELHRLIDSDGAGADDERDTLGDCFDGEIVVSFPLVDG